MNKLLLIFALLWPFAVYAQGTAAVQNHCFEGGINALTSGLSSTNFQQGIIPSCTVTVYLTGTQTKASIYADASGTALANPFTANAATSVDPGGWIFWAAVNTGYDVVMSGGISPNTYPSPVTIVGVYPGFQFSGGGSASPCGTIGQIQIANLAGTALDCDSAFAINKSTHTLTSTTGNMLVAALSSVPRAVYDPMDTNRDGGLAAAIAGTSGFTPTQVIQATIDYAECQVLTGKTVFSSIDIPLPAHVTIDLGGIELWGYTSIGGPGGASFALSPLLQHNNSAVEMIKAHSPGDTIVCNGTTYTPPAPTSIYVHDIQQSGMGAVATTTDIGIRLNAGVSVARNIAGTQQIFGGPAVISEQTTDFLQQIGFPGANAQGCKTYTSGTLPVSSYGPGVCGAVMSDSLDGGAENIYATDGQAYASGHAAGPCYPNCAAVVAGNNGGYVNNIFAQVSDIGVLFTAASVRSQNIRADFFSREAIYMTGVGGDKIDQVSIDSACTDTALQSNYNGGTATGCYAIKDATTGGSDQASGVTVVNNSAILAPAYVQCDIWDGRTGFSGTSDIFGFLTYQGNPNNTTANSWAYCGNFGNDQTAPRVIFPTQSPMQATGTTINANGVTSVYLSGQSVTSIVNGISGQRLLVSGVGTGTMKQSASGTSNGIFNLNGLDANVSGDTLEYVNIGTMANNNWQMLSGPPNQTPTHVNFAGNTAPSNPSLLHVIGNAQATPVPAFTIDAAVQLHGSAAPSGQACFVEQWLFPDGSQVISDQVCTTVDLSAQTAGEIFAVFPNSGAQAAQAAVNLWMTSNTEPNGIAVGLFSPNGTIGSPAFWNGPTTIAGGGNGWTASTPNDNDTGQFWGIGTKQICPSPLPTCSAEYRLLLCTAPGTGSSPDVVEQCGWNGTAYAWETVHSF